MKLIELLKKIVEKKKSKEDKDRSLKDVPFNEIKNRIEDKEMELKSKEKEIISLVKNLFSENIKEITEKIRILEEIDIDSKKAESKLKLIVKENIIQYVSNIRELTKKLSNLQEKSFNELITKSNKLFSDFDKRSYLNYEKATILIGKEIAEIKETLKKLYNRLKRIIEENKDIIHHLNSISIIKDSLEEVGKLKGFISELNNKRNLLDEKTEKITEKNKKLLIEIEEIKKSKNYSENLEKEKKIDLLRKELEKEIYSLKDRIDFKILGNVFHANEEKMRAIKYCKENFLYCFGNEERYLEIFNLIDEAGLCNEEISKKRNSIKNKKIEISEIENTIKEDTTKGLFSDIKKNNSMIEVLNIEREKILKNLRKTEEKIENCKKSAAEEAEKLDVTIKTN